MSERNGGGYFVPNDPDLATTTRNFDFKYIPPEYLERAIQKIRREQELQQCNTEKIKPQMHRTDCPHRLSTSKAQTSMVATGQQHKKPVIDSQECEDTQAVRDLSKQEIENLIRKAKTRTSPKTGKNLLQTQMLKENTQVPPIEPGRMNSQDARGSCKHNTNKLSQRAASRKELQKLNPDRLELELNFQDARGSCKDKTNKHSQRGESRKELQKLNPPLLKLEESLRDEHHSPYASQRDNQASNSNTPLRSQAGNERRIQRQYAQDDTWVQKQREICTPRLIHHGNHYTTREHVVSASTSPLPSQRGSKSPTTYITHQNVVYNGKISPLLSPRIPKPALVSTGTSPIISPKRDTQRKLSLTDSLNTSDNLNETFIQYKTYNIEHFEEVKPQVAQITDKIKVEAYRKPEAKWVEIFEANKENRIENEVPGNPLYMRRLKTPSTPVSPQRQEMYTQYKNFQRSFDGSIEMQTQLPTFLMTEVIRDNIRHAGGSINVSPHANVHQGVVATVELEDSDLELEIMDGPHYTLNVQPKLTQEELKALSIDRTDGTGELDEFLEIERGINEMDNDSYRGDTSPLSFEDTPDDDTAQNVNVNKIVISNRNNKSVRTSTNETETMKDPSCLPISDRSQNTSPTPTKKKRHRSKSLREQHLQETFDRLATAGRSRDRSRYYTACSTALSISTTPRVLSIQSARSFGSTRKSLSTSPIVPRLNVGSCTDRCPRKMREKLPKSGRRVWTPLKISQSLEDLKSEKTKIFNKMANIQEKILEILEKLRRDLLELRPPKNVSEKSKRQKNALEFAVRISRNFLYPLKGLLEELQQTHPEQFTSLSSNEACHRVCYIYNLVLQSLTTYQKQLRYFHLDPVPQKLPTLIEFIHTATVLCLEKRIFSRHDERIALLQQSCNTFLDFLQHLQKGTFIEERENYRKRTLERASPKYELKMVMNPLNMYEPKLVAKTTTPTNTARKKPKNKRHLTAVPMEETKDDIQEKPKDDLIPTLVRTCSVDATSSNEMQTESQLTLNSGSGDAVNPVFDKSVLEAMRLMTQEQVRQILNPIMQSLSTSLGYQNNPEVFEAIFSAVNSKVFSPMVDGKQLSEDNKCLPKEQTAAPTAKTPTSSGKAMKIPETALRTQSLANAESTCKPLEVANQTKMQSQQSSRSILAANRKHSAKTITTAPTVATVSSVAAMAASAAAAISTTAIIDAGDDCPTAYRQNNVNRNKNNNRRNNNRKSNARSLTPNSDNSTCPVWRRGSEGELTHKPNGEELTAITNKEESQRTNKSFRLMNEVVLNDEYECIDNDKKQQQQQRQKQQQQRVKSPKRKPFKKAPKQDRERVCDRFIRRCKQQRPLNKIPCSSSSSSTTTADSTDSLDSDNEATKFKGKNPNPQKFNKHKQQQRQHGHQLSHSQINISHKAEGVNAHSSSPSVLQCSNVKRNLKKPTSCKKRIQEEDCNSIKPNTPPTFSRDVMLTDESDASLDRILLHKMSKDLLDIPIPLTSASVLNAACGDNGSMNGEDTHDPNVERSAYAADCSESLTLYTNNSPYGESIPNMLQRPRPMSKKELQKSQPKLTHPTEINRKKSSVKVFEEVKPYPTMDSAESKSSHLNIDEMMQTRNQFLKLCEKNRFYKNPNFEEPWKIFSIISERLLNDILDTVELDFNEGVSKFVEDFLELETRTQK